MGFSLVVSTAAAEELSYDEKLKFAFKIEQISGHIISAVKNINEKEYGLAKMHLVHPAAEHSDLIDVLPDDSTCSQKLPLVLTMLQFTVPEYNKQVTDQRFSYVFQVLKECKKYVIDPKTDSNLAFNVDLMDNLLEKSVSEYKLSKKLYGNASLMESQDAMGLVMRAYIHIKSTKIFDEAYSEDISSKFKKLLVAHVSNSSLDKVISLTQPLRHEIADLTDVMAYHDHTIDEESIIAKAYLKGVYYSKDLIHLELHGENFDGDQKITIEYFSPLRKQSEIIYSVTNSKGEFYIPLELADSSFDESILFSITIRDIEFFEILNPQKQE